MRMLRNLALLMLGLTVALMLAACGATATTTVAPTNAPAAIVTTAPQLATAAPTTASTTVAATAPRPTTAPVATATPAAPAVKLKIVATTTQVGDFVKNVGGNRIDLVTILKPDVDAHDYEPTPEDSKALAAAQIIFSNGVGLEEWLDKTVKNSGTKGIEIVVSEGIKPRPGTTEEEKEGDPHVWFSTENTKIMVNNIAAGLSKLDPAGKAVYEANAKAYNAQIDDIAKQIKTLIDSIPADRRKLVTNHDAFGYFADQFGIKIIGSVIPSFDSTAEPSAKDLADLVAKIKAEKVPAIFTETSINPKLEEQISREAGVKIYSNLYGDSLGLPGTDGDTYLKMMLSNAKNLANGLK